MNRNKSSLRSWVAMEILLPHGDLDPFYPRPKTPPPKSDSGTENK